MGALALLAGLGCPQDLSGPIGPTPTAPKLRLGGPSGAITGTPAAPVIHLHPVSQAQVFGQALTFTVWASGPGLIGYQWFRNDLPIAGARGASYTTAPLGPEDAGATFKVLIGDEYGQTVTSTSAVVIREELSQEARPTLAAGEPSSAAGTGN